MSMERLTALRKKMNEKGIDVYYIPTSDFHCSEYIGDYFKTRSFMSGFTGSAGDMIVTKDMAGVWTDGRYFIQAEKELAGSGVTLFKMGLPETPTIEKFLKEKLSDGAVLSFDGRVMTTKRVKELEKTLPGFTIMSGDDLIDSLWVDRPTPFHGKAFLLDVKYSGKPTAEKLAMVRNSMDECRADIHVLASLDDIAWLYNIRGNDVPCNPVLTSFAVVTKEKAFLFAQKTSVSDEIQSILNHDGIELLPYDEIYSYVADFKKSEKVLLDPSKVNFAIYSKIKAEIIEQDNPTVLMKSMKNPVEVENLRNSHLKDGVAFTKFMYWIKNNIGKIEMNELTAAEYLLERRKEQEGFIEPSFGTICAYGANGAMMHYSADEENYSEIKPVGFLLVDSGGQYFDGTTDITRTMAMGPLTENEKLHFTAVLRSMLGLSAAKFLYGVRGVNLDILARGPIWDLNLDYRSGTGHGIGFLLNVHESPNGFRWKIVPERSDSCVLEEGMVTTNEPGIYLEGEYGIRTENEIVCLKGDENEYGQFMYFETITYAPIDLDAVNPDLMTERERKQLNDYHVMVYDKLSPHLDDEIKTWLKHYTRAI